MTEQTRRQVCSRRTGRNAAQQNSTAKRIAAAAILVLFAGCACAAYAASPEPSGSEPVPSASAQRTISVTLYLVDASGKPMDGAVILMQKDLESKEAYEGKTDGRGAVMIPSFPMTGFVLAVRNDSDVITGLTDVSLYPGSETRILNSPQSGQDKVTIDELQNTGLSSNINGSAALESVADEIPMHKYEVEVARDTNGVACLFQEQTGNDLVLLGVSEGQQGVIAPEPTLPPDDPDSPDASPSPSDTPQEPTSGPSPSASVSQSPTADPGPSATATVQPTDTQTPSAAPSNPDVPSQVPSTQPPAPSPTPVPTPVPTAVPTTQPSFVNMKLFLKDKQGAALPYYAAVLNDVAQATANGEGEVYFTNVPTNETNQLVVRNPDGTQVGLCGIRFIEGTETTLASVNSGGTYTINYAPGAQDVYVEIVVDTGGNAQTPITLEQASGQPLEPGSEPSAEEQPQPTGAPDAAATDAGAAVQSGEDVIGEPSISGPNLQGYFSTEAGVAIPGATIRLLNEDTKNLSSSITNSEGAFGMNRVPPGNYMISATASDGRSLGHVSFAVARGKKTQVKTAKDGNLYLTEGPSDSTVYLDLRELSNGTMDLMYASKAPLTAPAVLTQRTPRPSSQTDENLSVEAEMTTEVFEPTTREEPPAEMGTVVLVIVLCVAGVAVAAVLLTRNAHIR